MKLIVQFVLFFFIPFIINSQIVKTISVETKEPLELVSINCEFPNLFASTNKEGEADISKFQSAKQIEFRLIGYRNIIASFEELQKRKFLIELSPESMQITEVVVSATRWNQDLYELPIKIVEIPTLEVRNYNPQTAADLLSISGKVFIQKSQQGGGSPMIRGFAANRLLYIVDGIRMNTAIYRAGNIQNVISLDPFAIEKTEVLFGPNSVIYGSDAIGGIMTFQTLTPMLSKTIKSEYKANSFLRYSSANNEKTAHLDLNIGTEKIGFILSTTTNNYGDLRMGSIGPKEYLRNQYVRRDGNRDIIVKNSNNLIQKPSGYSQLNLMQKFLYQCLENLEMLFATHISTTSNYSRYDRHLRTKKGFPRYGQWDYGPQKWLMNNLFLDYKNNSSYFDEATLRLAWQRFNESRISRDFDSFYKQIREEKVDAYSLNIDFRKKYDSIEFYYGVEFVYDDVQSTGKNVNIQIGEYTNGPSRYPKSNWGSYAAYVSTKLNLADNFILQSGVRLNFYSLNADFDTTFYHFQFTKTSIDNSALTGNVGLLYYEKNHFSAFINLSSAFRSPNVDDIGKVFDSEPGAVVVPNPNLKAEYAYNIDCGLVKYFGKGIKVDLNLFYTHLSNAIVKRDYSLNGNDSIFYDGTLSKVQSLKNAAFARIWGVQSGFEIKFLKYYSLIGNLNFQKGEEELDNGSLSPSRHAAPLFGSIGLHYSLNNFFANIYFVFSGSKAYDDLPAEEKAKTEIYAIDSNGNPYSPSWYTINFKCNYNLVSSLNVILGIENITDQRYKTYSSGIAAAGRNFILSASFRY